MRELREQIMGSTGSMIWNGVEENGVELPLFGIPHVGNRRKLISSDVPKTKFAPEDLDLYGIGTRTAKGPLKSSSKNPKKGSGKESSGKGSSGKGSSGKGSSQGSGKGGGRPPVPRPTSSPGKPTPGPPGGCISEINVNFLQLSAIPPAIFVNPNDPDEQTLGTRYVYNDGLRNQDSLDELSGSNVSGTCTRTQARVGDASVGLQLGRGFCQFTYVLKDSKNREITFTVSGDVADAIGGILSITGGTKSTVGAYGEIELLPVNLAGDGQFEIEAGDFFLDPLFYLADARILVPCD